MKERFAVNKIYEKINLESYDIEFLRPIQKSELWDALHENNIPVKMPTNKQIVVTSKMLSLGYDFCVDFQFNDEDLVAITIAPIEYMEGKALYSRYKQIQEKLKEELGATHNILQLFVNRLNPDGSLSCWKCGNVEVKHYLFERFGMEEHI